MGNVNVNSDLSQRDPFLWKGHAYVYQSWQVGNYIIYISPNHLTVYSIGYTMIKSMRYGPDGERQGQPQRAKENIKDNFLSCFHYI